MLALMDLWEFCANETHERTDGNLTGMSDEDIADAAGWDGNPIQFVEALVDCRLVDGDAGSRQIHDWPLHQPFVAGFLKRSEQAAHAAQKRWHAHRMRPACAPHADRNADPEEEQCPDRSDPIRSDPSDLTDQTRPEDARPAEAGPSLADLETRYPDGLCPEVRAACALSRRSGKLADSVWLKTLRAMAPHPAEAVERAMRVFVDRHADGEKDERYLLGIVRRECRADGKTTFAPASPRANFENDTERGF